MKHTCDFIVQETLDDTQIFSIHDWTSLILHIYKTVLKTAIYGNKNWKGWDWHHQLNSSFISQSKQYLMPSNL